MQFLEHFSSVYASVGGSAKYSGLSKQPVKMKSGSGQNVSVLGQHDLNALLTYGVENSVLTELLLARSDHHNSKRKLYSSIVETGELPEIEKSGASEGGTLELKNTYMLALGLEII